MFIKTAEYLNLQPGDCAVAEDVMAGIEAAHNGCFISIGISDAKKSKLCDCNIETFSDLLKIL